MTLICVPILVHDEAPAHADALAARDAGADLVEFRIDDLLTPADDATQDLDQISRIILRLLTDSPLPCILTCRTEAEGGSFSGDEDDRLTIFESASNAADHRLAAENSGSIAAHPPRYIDIEHARFEKSTRARAVFRVASDQSANDPRPGLILSFHDFNSRPADLHRRLRAMAEESAASVIKIAYRARSLRDSLELLDLPRILHKPTISIGMGRFGLMTRILAPKFGAFLTFASLRPTTTTAPGQPTIRELLETYRFRSLKRTTSVFGVVGWPLEHTLSPRIHNAGFDALGIDAVLVPMPIASDNADPEGSYASFKATMLELVHHSSLDFRGCAVTIPHKQHLLKLAIESGWRVDDSALAIGAANTLVVRHDHLEVLNTDAPATAEVLAAALPPTTTLHDATIAILGAGGMARAAAFAAASAGARVIISNRTPQRAKALIASFPRPLAERMSVANSSALSNLSINALINATPLGMEGSQPSESPQLNLEPLATMNPNLLAMDSVYIPRSTPLLQQAQRLGLKAVDGLQLFVAQARRQFQAWTGRPAPEGLFTREASSALDEREH